MFVNVKLGRTQALGHTNVSFIYREIFRQKEVADSEL